MASLCRLGPLPPFPGSLVKAPLAYLLVYRLIFAIRFIPHDKMLILLTCRHQKHCVKDDPYIPFIGILASIKLEIDEKSLIEL